MTGSRMRRVLTVGLALLGVILTHATATADTGKTVEGLTVAEQKARISQLVLSARRQWGIELDGADYKVVDTGDGVAVQPKDLPDMHVTRTENKDGSGSVTASLDVGADPARFRSGEPQAQAEIEWYQSRCAEWLHDEHNVGSMKKCWQWGRAPYSNGRRNEVYKAWSTCLPTGQSATRELDDCWDQEARNSEGGPFELHDWGPRSTTTLSSCGDINLTVTAFGVSAGTVVRTCQKLVPVFGDEDGDFGTKWIGDAYKTEDVRETGHMMALSSNLAEYAGLTGEWGYHYSTCELTGVFDRCG